MARMIAFRKAHPILRQSRFLHSRERIIDGIEDLFWLRADGKPMTSSDWIDPMLSLVAVEMRTASGTPAYDALEYAIFAVFNAGAETKVVVPDPPEGQVWCEQIDTARPTIKPSHILHRKLTVAAHSVAILVLEQADVPHKEP
jgi:glycogen operon protein